MANLVAQIKAKNKGENIVSMESMMIESALNKLFHSEDRLEEKRAGMHASAVIKGESSFCFREHLLSVFFEMNQGLDHPTGLLKIFAAGNTIHEKWQKMFIDSGISCGIEDRSFSEDCFLYFTPDAKVRINGKKYICEIKSQNTYAFKKAKGHPSGEIQCLLYMHMTGIPRGFVLAEDKNDQNIKIYQVEYDYRKVIPYLERLQRIKEMISDYNEFRSLPTGICHSCSDKKANSCSMKDACFDMGKGRIPLIEEEPEEDEWDE